MQECVCNLISSALLRNLVAGLKIDSRYGEDCYCLQPWMIPEKAEITHGAADFKPMRVNDSYSFITYSAYLWLNSLGMARMPVF